MIHYISVDCLLKEKVPPILDVRSPVEFNAGHIPNAINLPLFTDDERAQIGTTYKNEGKQKAYLLGLELVGPKMKELVSRAFKLGIENKLIVHCWRGGQRSQSVAWLFENAGIQVDVLTGGYKAYRQFIKNYFVSGSFKFLVLSGKTGTAKTEILRQLKVAGEQIMDLEELAHHKGSAFGWIGEQVQNSNEQFENNLFYKLYFLKNEQFIWIENESRTIGKNFIPDAIWERMKSSPLINMERDRNKRLDHLIANYSRDDDNALILSFEKIRKRLGHERTQIGIDFIKENKYREAAGIALEYYDACYNYNLAENKSPQIFNIDFKEKGIEEIISDLIKFKNLHFGI